MKKIEIAKTLFISKNKEIGIVVKYPFWMKWLMGFIEFYIIPDIKNPKMILSSTFPYEVSDDSLFMKKYEGIFPKINIGNLQK